MFPVCRSSWHLWELHAQPDVIVSAGENSQSTCLKHGFRWIIIITTQQLGNETLNWVCIILLYLKCSIDFITYTFKLCVNQLFDSMLCMYFQYFYHHLHLWIFMKLCLEYRAAVLFLSGFQLCTELCMLSKIRLLTPCILCCIRSYFPQRGEKKASV